MVRKQRALAQVCYQDASFVHSAVFHLKRSTQAKDFLLGKGHPRRKNNLCLLYQTTAGTWGSDSRFCFSAWRDDHAQYWGEKYLFLGVTKMLLIRYSLDRVHE